MFQRNLNVATDPVKRRASSCEPNRQPAFAWRGRPAAVADGLSAQLGGEGTKGKTPAPAPAPYCAGGRRYQRVFPQKESWSVPDSPLVSLLRHSAKVALDPAAWMPWNYTEAFARAQAQRTGPPPA
jgi:hypothetical protein